MAFDGFMNIDGIQGDSTDDAHADWIEILSFSHGLAQDVGGSRSGGGAASAGRVDMSDFTIVKELDSASPLLHLQCCNGKHVPKVEIDLCRSGESKNLFMKYTLEDVLITQVSSGGASGADMPTEQVSFNAGKVLWSYTKTDPKSGAAGGNVDASWDNVLNVGG